MQYIEIALLVIIILILLAKRLPKSMKSTTSRKVILDSCALIDGRIIELSRMGFVPEELIVPEFVLHELQILADGNDSYKRERARFGLDVVKELQSSKYCTVIINHHLANVKMATDDKLVALAKQINASLYTTDFNLNKVADIQGVQVLNVNDLAQQLRPSVLPGEKRSIKILQKGSNHQQGVGYLEDGTMVVVDGAAKSINKVVEVEIARNFQTVAGKMLFAALVNKSRD